MPKTHKNLYQQLLSFEALHSAWAKAQRGRRYKPAVLAFESSLEENLLLILADLESGAYRTGAYRRFFVFEPKKREIARLRDFRDRVVQHAIVAALNPIYERMFIADSFACRKDKGTHAGANRSQQMLRAVRREHDAAFALKCDISKYFDNIHHDILLRIIARKVSDKRMLNLISDILSSYSEGKGIPLGNLTSQLFANIYLNELDQHVKRELKETHYIRYMDDFVILSNDKVHLHELRGHLESWLRHHLRLELNAKTAVFPVSAKNGRPLDFLGYRILPNRRMLRRGSITRMRQKIKILHQQYANHEIDFTQIKQAMSSHIAHANHADSHGILLSVLRQPFKRIVINEVHCI